MSEILTDPDLPKLVSLDAGRRSADMVDNLLSDISTLKGPEALGFLDSVETVKMEPLISRDTILGGSTTLAEPQTLAVLPVCLHCSSLDPTAACTCPMNLYTDNGIATNCSLTDQTVPSDHSMETMDHQQEVSSAISATTSTTSSSSLINIPTEIMQMNSENALNYDTSLDDGEICPNSDTLCQQVIMDKALLLNNINTDIALDIDNCQSNGIICPNNETNTKNIGSTDVVCPSKDTLCQIISDNALLLGDDADLILNDNICLNTEVICPKNDDEINPNRETLSPDNSPLLNNILSPKDITLPDDFMASPEPSEEFSLGTASQQVFTTKLSPQQMLTEPLSYSSTSSSSVDSAFSQSLLIQMSESDQSPPHQPTISYDNLFEGIFSNDKNNSVINFTTLNTESLLTTNNSEVSSLGEKDIYKEVQSDDTEIDATLISLLC